MKKKTLTATMLSLFNAACLFDGNSNTIIQDYSVAWTDVESSQALYKHEKLVDPYVYAAAKTDSFIIAKQHPVINGRINYDSTNYFFIGISTNVYQDKSVIGPVSPLAYDSVAKALGISTVRFQTYHSPAWRFKHMED